MFIRMIFSILFLFVMHGVFGVDSDEVMSMSVMEGDSVILHTDLTEIQRHDYIVWMFGPQGNRIAEMYKNRIDMYDSNDTFGDRLKLDNKTESFTITDIRITDSGLYKLQIISNRGTAFKRYNVTVYAHLPVPVIIRNKTIANHTQHANITEIYHSPCCSLTETVIRLVISAVVGVAALTVLLYELS
ncbi:hypothetical protein E1301_Tti021803 [Triplophysa tibetana]|uniref:Immunoglobulin domain-containing protein n=1 Tax=Triplophysa tibetana TaxID=1572043 RepID=A0A5A9NSK7_9TELE|nr:hypothetical protein E1301_Tti021803 [Triplophysa tibetana]